MWFQCLKDIYMICFFSSTDADDVEVNPADVPASRTNTEATPITLMTSMIPAMCPPNNSLASTSSMNTQKVGVPVSSSASVSTTFMPIIPTQSFHPQPPLLQSSNGPTLLPPMYSSRSQNGSPAITPSITPKLTPNVTPNNTPQVTPSATPMPTAPTHPFIPKAFTIAPPAFSNVFTPTFAPVPPPPSSSSIPSFFQPAPTPPMFTPAVPILNSDSFGEQPAVVPMAPASTNNNWTPPIFGKNESC